MAGTGGDFGAGAGGEIRPEGGNGAGGGNGAIGASGEGPGPARGPVGGGPEAADAFIVYNEREDLVSKAVEDLKARGLTTYFWREDIKPGVEWQALEQQRLKAARNVVVFLGPAGWGPHHRRLAISAQEQNLRIVPVLVEGYPPAALGDAGALFERLHYLSLRGASWEEDLDALAGSLQGPQGAPDLQGPPETFEARPRDYGALISILVDGDEAQRGSLVRAVAEGRIAPDPGFRDLLIEQVRERFQPRAVGERPQARLAGIRSWMMSTLIWLDPEDAAASALLLDHLDPEIEPDASVRFWVLGGLLQRQVSYISEAVDRGYKDVAPEVALLAGMGVGSRKSWVDRLRRSLSSTVFDDVWAALRVMRIVPVPELVTEVAGLFDSRIQERWLDYEVLHALAHPESAPRGVEALVGRFGLPGFLHRLGDILGESDEAATRRVAGLLTPIDPVELGHAVAQLSAEQPHIGATLDRLRAEAVSQRAHASSAGRYIAGFQSESLDVSKDYLDIQEDVETLTAVMLAKDVDPPLAIGLFGDWGSGKSFFMEKMRATTRTLIARKSPAYCADVVPIEFNAWHYADSNLWASLVSHILETLSDHVSPETLPEKREAELINTLTSAKEAIKEIEAEKTAAETLLGERQSELETLQAARAAKETSLRDLGVGDLQAVLAGDAAAKGALDSALAELGAPAVIGGLSDLHAAVAEVNTLQGRMVAFALGLVKGPDRRVMIPLLALVIAIPILAPIALGALKTYFPVRFAAFTTAMAEIAAILVAIAHVWRKSAAWVEARFKQLESARDKVQTQLDAKRAAASVAEVALQGQIATLKAQEDQVAERLKAATARVVELEQKVAAIQDGRSLVRFLTERSGSDDYRRHQGLVSTVRRDFEALAERLGQQPTAPGGRRVERIILYIDDLDRVPEEKVIEVLEAVHLLLAYKLFVVVVGVDPRWLAHALSKTYGAFDATGQKAGWRTTPQDYLEKIFQIPINLRPMSAGGFDRLMKGLLGPGEATPGAAAPRGGILAQPAEAPPAAQVLDGNGDAAPREATADGTPSRAVEAPPESAAADVVAKVPAAAPEAGDGVVVAEEALIITPQEMQFAARLHALFSTPRSTKRFANTWRLLKASIAREGLPAFEGTETTPGSFRAPMLLLALVVGSPALAESVLARMHGAASAGEDILSTLRAGPADGSSVPQAIAALTADADFPNTPGFYAEWMPKVSRFSFDVGRSFRASAPPQAARPAAT